MTVLAGVLGFPIRHSRSPAMMNAAFEELGLAWRYLALPVATGLFRDTVLALRASGYVGANVTIPHKPAAAALADRLTPAAEAIGAANTLLFHEGGVEADNTDAGGLIDALGESAHGRSALVLGAGGAGRAAAWALREAGAEVAVWNRTPERAAALASELEVEHLGAPEAAELLVNATSVGLEPDQDAVAKLGVAGLPAPAVVVDLVYRDGPTELCRWAAAHGARVVDGAEVLVRQGGRSLERWTGRPAPLETMQAAVRRSSA